MGKSGRPKAVKSERPKESEVDVMLEKAFGSEWTEYCKRRVPENIRIQAILAETMANLSFLVGVDKKNHLAVDGDRLENHLRLVSAYSVSGRDAKSVQVGISQMVKDFLGDIIQGLIDEQKEILKPGQGILEGTVTSTNDNCVIVATSKDGNGGGRSYYIPRDETTRGIVDGDSVRICPNGKRKDGPLETADFAGNVPDYAKMAAEVFMS
jgi:hypothetical protein